MNWDAIGAMGEVIGALAVVATILYLAIQLRMSNKFEAAKHQDVHMDRIRQRYLVVAQDGDLMRIVTAAARGEELDRTEAARAASFAAHRILVQRDAWARARILGKMRGLPEPNLYLDILIDEMKRDQCLLNRWKKDAPRSVAWESEFKEYIDRGLAE